MQITLNRESAKVLSPFGRMIRPFTEIDNQGKEFVVGKGKTMPDLARLYYNVKKVTPFSGNFGFLDRDNKERVYNPGIEDGLVFKNDSSIDEFGKSAKYLIDVLCKSWVELGLPLKLDKDRKINLPDGDAVWKLVSTPSKDRDKIMSVFKEVSFILANVDIMKKACIVRAVIPGWWAASYAGKDSKDLKHFLPSIRAHVKACHILLNSSKFKKIRAKVADTVGDPFDSNAGYPVYTALQDSVGRPTSKIQVITIFKGLGYAGHSVSKLFQEVDLRSTGMGVDGFPFAIAPIRRNSYGWKFSHVFTPSPLGLITAFDERGSNTTRIAWAVPYIFNLFMSPLQSEWKSLRKMMPGLYHEGSTQVNRIKMFKKSQSIIVTEADYSNYDRFIPVDMFMLFAKMYTQSRPNGNFWFDMCHAIHHKMSIIWPDYIGSEQKHGWIFSPEKLGLLSGVKITSEEGSFVNSIINGQSRIDAGLMTEQSMINYLTQYKDESSDMGTLPEHWMVLGDDTAHISHSVEEAVKVGDAFTANVERAGLNGEIMIGDRFLMRSINNGRDTPVPARIWQNTLQNETPYTDALNFMVALCIRSDGMFGQKTFDPFNTGKIQATIRVEVEFSLAVAKNLKQFLSTASNSQSQAVDFISLLVEAGTYMLSEGGSSLKISSSYALRLDEFRLKYLELLAKREQMLAVSQDEREIALKSLIYQLHRDSNIPSQALLLSQILEANPRLTSIVDQIVNKENAFYKAAMKTVGLDTYI